MAAEDSPSPEIIYPQWLKEYEVALLEPEAEMLSKRVEAAKPQSTRDFSKFRKTLTITRKGKSSRTRLQSFEF